MSRIDNSRPLRQREPRVRDRGYLAWLHEGIPCIACLIKGKPKATWTQIGMPHGFELTYPIEAAHQKLAIASARWFEQRGKRVSDERCCPLCGWHHRLAPDACDVNQRAFWDRLGLGDRVADLCTELYDAYQTGGDGAAVVRRFAR